RTIRSLGNYPLRTKSWYDYNGCYDRHAVAMCEKVHISALQRLGESVPRLRLASRLMDRYEPPNLVAALSVIRATYRAPGVPAPSGAQIHVVDWSGEQFSPDSPRDCQTVLNEVSAAEQRLA